MAPLAGTTRRDGMRARALRTRLVLIVAVVCAAVWLSTLFDLVRDRQETLALAARQHGNIASALSEQAARALQAADLIVQPAALVAPHTRPTPVPRAAIPALLRRHMSGVPQVKNLFLFDPARQLHLSTAVGAAAFDL